MTDDRATQRDAGWQNGETPGDPPPRSGWIAFVGGAIAAISSALVIVFLLSINGAFALVLFTVLANSDSSVLQRKDVLQFGLLTLPLILLIAELFLWDFFRSLFGRSSGEDD